MLKPHLFVNDMIDIFCKLDYNFWILVFSQFLYYLNVMAATWHTFKFISIIVFPSTLSEA